MLTSGLGPIRNQLLSGLSAGDQEVLLVRARRIEHPARSVLLHQGEAFERAYFPETGYISLVALLEDGSAAEVGVAGNEGMVGLPILYGDHVSQVEAVSQAGGSGVSVPAIELRRAMAERPAIASRLLRYALAFTAQLTATAACNSRHRLEQRLARWLLMALERVKGDMIPMTHELLSVMLGVRRAGVSVAAAALQRDGLIRYDNGTVQVLDRPGLIAASCGCQAIADREYERLLGRRPVN